MDTVQLVISSLVSSGAVWLAIRTDIRWLIKSVDRHDEEIKSITQRIFYVRK